MRRALLIVVVLSSSCAEKRPPTLAAAPVTMRYVFVESLPPETQVCVRRSPWLEELTCWSLGELRHTMRAMRRAALEP